MYLVTFHHCVYLGMYSNAAYLNWSLTWCDGVWKGAVFSVWMFWCLDAVLPVSLLLFSRTGDGYDAESSFWLPETQIWGKVSKKWSDDRIISVAVESWDSNESDQHIFPLYECLQNLNHPCNCRPVFSQEIRPQQKTHNGEIQHSLQPR